jgi:hypothetical protein
MANTYFSNAAVDDALTGLANAGAWISLHNASPGTTGANEIAGGSYGRVQTTWGAASGSSCAGSQVTLNVPAATTIGWFGVWSASSGGTYLEGGPLSAQETFGAAGTYELTPTLSGQG